MFVFPPLYNNKNIIRFHFIISNQPSFSDCINHRNIRKHVELKYEVMKQKFIPAENNSESYQVKIKNLFHH